MGRGAGMSCAGKERSLNSTGWKNYGALVEMKGIVASSCLLMVCGIMQQLEMGSFLDCMPRKTVTYQSGNINIFWKPRISNFSSLLINEETNTLYAGTKDYILALDLNDISKEITRASWFASEDGQLECLRRGKSKPECQNYILLLHKINASSLYICGTNAFHPACRYVIIGKTVLKLHGKAVESRGKCPFDPTMRSASLMVDGALYSATSNNFLGTEPIILRSLRNPLRTEFKASWLNEPTFVHMELMQDNGASSGSERIYIFFTETAVEFEFYNKLLISRIAQICKDDLGGKRILKKRWTSFLKTTLVCSAPESDFQFNIIQDAFVLKAANWRENIFYGIFTQQWGRLDISAVCAFRMEAVQDVFSKGNFKAPFAMENLHMKWVVHQGDIPSPRPGACIDVSAQGQGYSSSFDLPDRVLQFARDHPLMDDTVNPINHHPVLLKRGSKYTRIVVHRTSGLDNITYDILFLGTENGYLHKALNCWGEMFIVEEIQLFPSPEPVQILKLSPQKCLHEVFILIHPFFSRDLIQNIKSGDASGCLEVDKKIKRYPVALGSSLSLKCTPMSNLASLMWMFNGSHLQIKEAKHLFLIGALIIFNVTVADTGFYECQSVEKASGKEFHVTMATYFLYPQQGKDSLAIQHNLLHRMRANSAVPASWSLVPPEIEDPMRQEQPSRIQGPLLTSMLLGFAFAFLFLTLLAWNIYKGHLTVPCKSRRSETTEASRSASPEHSLALLGSIQKSSTTQTIISITSESAPLVSLPEECGSGKVKHSPNLSSSTPSCLVMDKTEFPSEECEA
ncbi:hypothetical protein lerEdw1_008542 [Lerista edwardsae]|nr:hypothetical protein lerEdw1_008542 [Lerista edwardsae]